MYNTTAEEHNAVQRNRRERGTMTSRAARSYVAPSLALVQCLAHTLSCMLTQEGKEGEMREGGRQGEKGGESVKIPHRTPLCLLCVVKPTCYSKGPWKTDFVDL